MTSAFPGSKSRLGPLVGVLAVMGGWVYVTMLVIPSFQNAARVTQEIRSMREQRRNLERVLASEEEIRKQQVELKQTVATLRSLLPSETDLPSILEQLTQVAGRAQVKIQTIAPRLNFTKQELAQMLEEGEFRQPIYRKIPIQVDALAGFHEIGTFLSLLETKPIPMKIATLRITSNPKDARGHHLTVILDVSFLVSEEKADAARRS